MVEQEGDSGGLDELPDDGSIDWAITRALLAANDATSAALEMHLVQTQYRGDDGSNSAAIRQHIDEAIEHHEQIIEDLRFAREAVDHRST
ncbi:MULTISPECIES: hypothetical protein [Haloferax]|uniref:DUF8103 domain-containing protein n=1 Tax=Haloferax marinum TaxID=2666143 RepID=A0A6A8G828_9EURY|nr:MULTISPECIES: hypothetical protein [Haloferax]KAB1198154.1 hypothetical protein Hfx1150_11750 [Haloferax sp. CBA1150]MRW97234.1 hypothetical protein [Haloferax marinum]